MPLYGLPVCNSVLTWVWLVTAVQGRTVGPSEARRLQKQNEQEKVIVEHYTTKNRKYPIPNNICTTRVHYLVNILVWKGHCCYGFGT